MFSACAERARYQIFSLCRSSLICTRFTIMPTLQHILIAMQPRFNVPANNLSIRRCAYCPKHIAGGDQRIFHRCSCGSCEYCSPEYQSKDWSIHHTRCSTIQEMSKDTGRRAKNLGRAAPRIHDLFEYNFLECTNPSRWVQLSNDLKDYFDCQEKMIKEIIHKGYRRLSM